MDGRLTAPAAKAPAMGLEAMTNATDAFFTKHSRFRRGVYSSVAAADPAMTALSIGDSCARESRPTNQVHCVSLHSKIESIAVLARSAQKLECLSRLWSQAMLSKDVPSCRPLAAQRCTALS